MSSLYSLKDEQLFVYEPLDVPWKYNYYWWVHTPYYEYMVAKIWFKDHQYVVPTILMYLPDFDIELEHKKLIRWMKRFYMVVYEPLIDVRTSFEDNSATTWIDQLGKYTWYVRSPKRFGNVMLTGYRNAVYANGHDEEEMRHWYNLKEAYDQGTGYVVLSKVYSNFYEVTLDTGKSFYVSFR